MFKWLKKRLGLEPQPIDPDFGTRLGKAMVPIKTDAIKADKITASDGWLIDRSGSQIDMSKFTKGLKEIPVDALYAGQLTSEQLASVNEAVMSPGEVVMTPVQMRRTELDVSAWEKIINEAEELVDMLYRDSGASVYRIYASRLAEQLRVQFDYMLAQEILVVKRKPTDRLPGESDADHLDRLLEMARNKK